MLGDESGWRYKQTYARPAYSRALSIWRNQPHKLGIISGGTYDDGAVNKSRPLSIWVTDLDALVRLAEPPEGPTPLQIYYPDLVRMA